MLSALTVLFYYSFIIHYFTVCQLLLCFLLFGLVYQIVSSFSVVLSSDLSNFVRFSVQTFKVFLITGRLDFMIIQCTSLTEPILI